MALLNKLPWVGPLIWVGWFSAIQYGNTIRVQEDYEFKEATAKAFIGFRDHMEHLSKINNQEGENAMNQLAIKTIQVLSNEPLRIYKHAESESIPSNKMFGFVNKILSGKAE